MKVEFTSEGADMTNSRSNAIIRINMVVAMSRPLDLCYLYRPCQGMGREVI